MLTPHLGLSGGVKYLKGNGTARVDYNALGLSLNVIFNYPIDKLKLVFYCSGSLMPLSGEINETNYDIIGFSFAAGIQHKLLNNCSIKAGYKYQELEWNDLADDQMKGITFGIDYRF